MTDTNYTKTDMPGNDSFIENSVLKESLPLTAIFILLYVIVFFTGIGGNSLVVYVVLQNKAMQSIMNMFITNLALSDIMLCFLAVPFTPLSYFMDTWIFGGFFCHTVPMMLCVLVYVSTLTCTALAIVRYFAIVYPLKPKMKARVCLLTIAAIWVVSLALSLPLGMYQQLEVDESISCVERWPSNHMRQIFVITSLALQFVVPCSIITFCYSIISLALHRRSASKIVNESITCERATIELVRNSRINKMMIVVVTIFVTSWLPLNLVLLVTEYHPKLSVSQYYSLIFFTAHVIAMSSATYNPFLYAWKCEKFRNEFKLILPSCPCLSRHE